MKTLPILALILVVFACGQEEKLPAQKDELAQAKEWFLTNAAGLPSNLTLDWEKANKIKEPARVIYEVPMLPKKRQSVKPEGAKLDVPISQLLLIYKSAEDHRYAIADFMPDWDYTFAYNFGKEQVSFTRMHQYKGTILFRDISGKVLDGYQFDGEAVKRWAGTGKAAEQKSARVANIDCIAVTYNYYVMSCSPYGCSTHFDYSETNFYCSGGGGVSGGGLGEFIPSGGGGGNGGGNGIVGHEIRDLIWNMEPFPPAYELNERLSVSFRNKFVTPIQAQDGKLCTLGDVLDYVSQNMDALTLVDDYQSINYPNGHPHNHAYTYGFGVKVGTFSNPNMMPDYDYNGDAPMFLPGSPYGSVLNPGHQVIVINTCNPNEQWLVSFHVYIKSIG